MRRVGFVAALGLLVTASSARAVDETGRAAYQFLNLGTGARVEALGGTGASLADGSDALDWNPARLSDLDAPSASVSWFNWLSDVEGGTASGAIPFGKGRALGIAARSLAVGEFSNTTAEASISQSDVAVGLGAGVPLVERLRGGAGLKVVRSSLAGEHATGWALDAGLDYRWVRGWDLVAALRNAGPAFGYGDAPGDRLPTEMRFGVGGTASRLRFAFEGAWQPDGKAGGGAGVEWKVLDRLALRAGSRLESSQDDAAEPWSLGVGFEARPGLSVDYSFRDSQFDASHRLALCWTPGAMAAATRMEPARSPREFYVGALDEALNKGLTGLPGASGDSVVVRAVKTSPAADVVAETLAGRLKNRGFRVGVLAPPATLPDSATAEQKKVFEAAVKPLVVGVPLVEFDVKTSSYDILASSRERWVGPKTVQRRVTVDITLSRRLPDEAAPSWASSGSATATERVEGSRIPVSTGYPQPPAAEAGHMNPYLEPALVTGIVATLAVIFFSNRNVGS